MKGYEMSAVMQKAKYAILALYSLGLAGTFTSCSSTKRICDTVYDGTASLIEGTADSLPWVNKLKSNITESHDKRIERRILALKEDLEDAQYEDIIKNRGLFVGVIKDMSRFILAKSAGDPENNIPRKNIQYVIPSMEEEFMNSDVAKSYGGRKKNAVKVLIESFKIMSYYFSEEASQSFFKKASYSTALCKQFHILREKDDGLTRRKAMIQNARMIGFTMDVSKDVMDKETELFITIKGQEFLNFIRGKENN